MSAGAAAFVLVSVVLAATPGPGVVYIVTRTLAQGRRAGLASVAGVALGNLGNAAGASVGLAALFALSAAAFDAVRLAGAAYLVWLGIATLRRGPAGASTAARAAPAWHRIVGDGFTVALLNPKTALFFAAFLPQFIDPVRPALAQSLALAALFVLVAALTDTGYVLATARVAARLGGGGRAARIGRRAGAAAFIGLGVAAAATGMRAPR